MNKSTYEYEYTYKADNGKRLLGLIILFINIIGGAAWGADWMFHKIVDKDAEDHGKSKSMPLPSAQRNFLIRDKICKENDKKDSRVKIMYSSETEEA